MAVLGSIISLKVVENFSNKFHIKHKLSTIFGIILIPREC